MKLGVWKAREENGLQRKENVWKRRMKQRKEQKTEIAREKNH